MIKIAHPEIGPEEIQAVNEVLQSGILAQGPRVAQLEEDFAKYCGTNYSLAVNSGTAAIHAALYAVGVTTGDEVITTPFSFIATINPILMVGAHPVLVDIDPETFNIDVSKIEAAITDKTKAIIPVHLYGQPADMVELKAIADKHNLAIIEDACQAISAEYAGAKTGSIGDIGCFSLYATKNIMSGEGGMVTTNNEEYAKRIRQFRQHGMSAPYVYEELGYNYRLTDLQAAIAIEQLKKADRFAAARQENAVALTEGLKDVSHIIVPTVKNGRTHVYHQYTIRLQPELGVSREDFVAKLMEREVGSGIYYPRPLHSYPHIEKLGYKMGDFPEAEKAAAEVVSLPVHPHVSKEDIAIIVAAVKEVVNG